MVKSAVSAKVTDPAGNSKTVATKLTLDTSADSDNNLSVTVDTVINNGGKTQVISTLSGVDSDAKTVVVTYTDKNDKKVTANATYNDSKKAWDSRAGGPERAGGWRHRRQSQA